MNAKSLGIAIAAGIACVLAVYSALHAGAAAVPLLVLAALPIYICALAWGTFPGAAASVTAIIAASFLISPQAGIVIGLGTTIPASVAGHQANLAQENSTGGMDWYPLSRLLLNLVLVLTVSILLIGYFMNYQSYETSPEFRLAVQEYFRQFPPQVPLTDEQMSQIARSLFRTLPFMFASLWLIIHVVNLQIAAIVCRASGIMPRPKDDIPGTIYMPKEGLFFLAVGILGMLVFSGMLQWIAIVLAGMFLTAFALVGLASAHFRARGAPINFVFLVLGYILIAIFYLPLFLFAIGGIVRTFSNSTSNPPSAGSNLS